MMKLFMKLKKSLNNVKTKNEIIYLFIRLIFIITSIITIYFSFFLQIFLLNFVKIEPIILSFIILTITFLLLILNYYIFFITQKKQKTRMDMIKYNLDHYNIDIIEFISIYYKKISKNNENEILEYIKEKNPDYYYKLKIYFKNNKKGFKNYIYKKLMIDQFTQ